MVKTKDIEKYIMEGVQVKLNRKDFFTEEDCVKDSDNLDWNGKILVLCKNSLMDFMEVYQKPEFQLWKCDGGFGASPFTNGTAVFATCLADEEESRFSRGDYYGILKPEIVKELGLE